MHHLQSIQHNPWNYVIKQYSTHNNPHDSTSSAISSSNNDNEDEEERGTQHHQEAGDEEEDRVGNDGDDYDADSDDDEMPPLEGEEEDETEEDVRVTAVQRRILWRYGSLSNTERSAFRSRMSDYRRDMNLTVYEFMLHLYENPELMHRFFIQENELKMKKKMTMKKKIVKKNRNR